MAQRIQRPATAFSLGGGGLKRPRAKAEAHLAFIRSLPCIVSGREGVEAAHVRLSSLIHGKRETGKSEKPDDRWTVPLSPEEHRRQHGGSERGYWRRERIDPLIIAALLWGASGDDEAGRLIIANARELSSGNAL